MRHKQIGPTLIGLSEKARVTRCRLNRKAQLTFMFPIHVSVVMRGTGQGGCRESPIGRRPGLSHHGAQFLSGARRTREGYMVGKNLTPRISPPNRACHINYLFLFRCMVSLVDSIITVRQDMKLHY